MNFALVFCFSVFSFSVFHFFIFSFFLPLLAVVAAVIFFPPDFPPFFFSFLLNARGSYCTGLRPNAPHHKHPPFQASGSRIQSSATNAPWLIFSYCWSCYPSGWRRACDLLGIDILMMCLGAAASFTALLKETTTTPWPSCTFGICAKCRDIPTVC